MTVPVFSWRLQSADGDLTTMIVHPLEVICLRWGMPDSVETRDIDEALEFAARLINTSDLNTYTVVDAPIRVPEEVVDFGSMLGRNPTDINPHTIAAWWEDRVSLPALCRLVRWQPSTVHPVYRKQP